MAQARYLVHIPIVGVSVYRRGVQPLSGHILVVLTFQPNDVTPPGMVGTHFGQGLPEEKDGIGFTATRARMFTSLDCYSY